MLLLQKVGTVDRDNTVRHNVSKHNVNTSLGESTSEHLNSLVDNVLHCGLARARTCSGCWSQDSFRAGHNRCCSSSCRTQDRVI